MLTCPQIRVLNFPSRSQSFAFCTPCSSLNLLATRTSFVRKIRVLDYSGTHSLSIFAFNFRCTQISAQIRLFALTGFVRCTHFTPSRKTIINCFVRQSRKSASWICFALVAVVDFTTLSSTSPLAYQVSLRSLVRKSATCRSILLRLYHLSNSLHRELLQLFLENVVANIAYVDQALQH